ncbi:hypothetical protein Hanom_Chr05g00436581 [Helianthus anomalus]
MAGKDAEIAELQCRMRESQEKVDSLEINLEAGKQKAESAVANAVLNSVELDQTVAALTVATRHMGHHEGYIKCASHIDVALLKKWNASHCSVNAEVEKGFSQAQERYNTLSLPIMDLVSDALQHDDYVKQLKAIFEVTETQELSDDEEDDAGDDGEE